jgi:hypothetical protein
MIKGNISRLWSGCFLNSSVRLFADDCLLYRTIKKEEDHLTLQADLKIVKTIVINGKIHKNKRKRFYSSNKEGLIWGTL